MMDALNVGDFRSETPTRRKLLLKKYCIYRYLYRYIEDRKRYKHSQRKTYIGEREFTTIAHLCLEGEDGWDGGK